MPLGYTQLNEGLAPESEPDAAPEAEPETDDNDDAAKEDE